MYQIFIMDPYNKTQVMEIDETTTCYDCFVFISRRVGNENDLLHRYEEGRLTYLFERSCKYLDKNVGLIKQGVAKDETLRIVIKPVV